MAYKKAAFLAVPFLMFCALYYVFATTSGLSRSIPDCSFASISQKTQKSGAPPEETILPLPSGWDAAGIKIYRDRKQATSESLTTNPNAVLEHTVLPLGPVRTSHVWFRGKKFDGSGQGTWEHQTFVNFFHHISGCRYFVEFGSWIGPTLFYAAQLVEKAVAIDGDPQAVADLETNLALNADKPWAHHTSIHPHVVGLGSSTTVNATSLTMRGKAGNSCSGVAAIHRCGSNGAVEWKVNAYSLPAILNRLNIPVNRGLFIKVDVESFECQLVPTWLEWIRSLPESKPVFHLAFHKQIAHCSEEQYRSVYEFAKLFDYASENCLNDEKQLWTCGSGEFVMYDNI